MNRQQPNDDHEPAPEQVQASLLERRREAFFDELEAMGAASDLSPEEADALADEAVRAVRQAPR